MKKLKISKFEITTELLGSNIFIRYRYIFCLMTPLACYIFFSLCVKALPDEKGVLKGFRF